MEHRYSERKEVELEAIIVDKRVGQIKSKVKNASLDGLFVKTSAKHLRENSMVELIITLENSDDYLIFIVSGYIVHTRRDGVGVIFCEYDEDFAHTLKHLIYGHHRVRLKQALN